MLTEWIRRTGFWMMDALRGGEIRRHYKDVRFRNTSRTPNEEQLRKLLRWSTQQTEFYKDCNPEDIHSFPVLTKNMLRERRDEILAKPFAGKKLYEVSTSGSTGIPLRIFWDPGKRKRQIAEMIYFYEVAGQRFGQRMVYFRENQHRKKKKKLNQWAKNIYDYDVTSFDDRKMGEILKRLLRRPFVHCYIAYGSFHEAFLQYLDDPEKGGRADLSRFPVKVIVSGSELLRMQSKKRIAEITGARVIDRYSNEENGFLAQSEDCSDEFAVNLAGFYVEILKQENDEPAADGEIGRIVITDLYNFAVPLIRYDTGDLSVRWKSVNGWTSVLKTIHGRQSDVIFDTKGAKMTTSVWNAYMGDFDRIRQYQMIQEDAKQYRLVVNGAKGIYRDEELIAAVKRAVGEDAEVMIEHVNGIPALSSGKFKKTVCLYRP